MGSSCSVAAERPAPRPAAPSPPSSAAPPSSAEAPRHGAEEVALAGAWFAGMLEWRRRLGKAAVLSAAEVALGAAAARAVRVAERAAAGAAAVPRPSRVRAGPAGTVVCEWLPDLLPGALRRGAGGEVACGAIRVRWDDATVVRVVRATPPHSDHRAGPDCGGTVRVVDAEGRPFYERRSPGVDLWYEDIVDGIASDASAGSVAGGDGDIVSDAGGDGDAVGERLLGRRGDEPAELSSQAVLFYRRGELHRPEELGPALVAFDSSYSYYRDGRLHRRGGPARRVANEVTQYFRDGDLHREDGPAEFYDDGKIVYWVAGKKHRPAACGGDAEPAEIEADGTRRWFVDGQPCRPGGGLEVEYPAALPDVPMLPPTPPLTP